MLTASGELSGMIKFVYREPVEQWLRLRFSWQAPGGLPKRHLRTPNAQPQIENAQVSMYSIITGTSAEVSRFFASMCT